MTVISLIGWAIILLHLPHFSMFANMELFVFLGLCILASNTFIQFKSGMAMTLTSPVTIFLLLSTDMNTTLFISVIGIASFQIRNRRGFARTIFNVAQLTISTYLTGLFLYLFHNGQVILPDDFIYIGPAIMIFELANMLFVSIAIAFRNAEPLKLVLISSLQESQVGMPLYLANGLIMYICYTAYGLWGLTLVIIPLFSVNWLLKASKNADQHKEDAYLCPTTKLKNKRCLNEWLENEFYTVVRHDANISFILIDIDDFKHVNDRFGHDVGDHVLTEFGQLLRENLRDTDLIYRYGGEEFVVILPGFPEEQAHTVIERLRSLVHEHAFTGGQLRVTFSAGIASLDSGLLYDRKMNAADEMIRRADKAMYTAKQSGKNQTRFYNH